MILAAGLAYANSKGYMADYACMKEALVLFGGGMAALGIGDKIQNLVGGVVNFADAMIAEGEEVLIEVDEG